MKRFVTILALVAGFAAAQAPDVWQLPGDAVFPEGIAADEASFWVGSAVDGTIYRGDLASGEVEVLAQGAQPGAFGMAIDMDGVLWVAGGDTGNLYRYDATTGELTGTFTTPPSANIFLNDVALGDDGSVYVTDSFRPILFRIPPAAAPGPMDAWASFEGTPIEYEVGFNLNGIVTTDDDRYLITVQTLNGRLFRISIADGTIVPIEVEADLSGGDGLVLDGTTLYVVRNRAAEIVPIELSDDFASGTAGPSITSDAFAFPTTAALVEEGLLVVNSQLDEQGTGRADLPFTVVRIPLQ